MDSKEIKGLMEAYNQVYELDENRMDSRMEKMPPAPAKVGKGTHSIKDIPVSREPSSEEKAKARKALGLGEKVEQVDELYQGKHGQSETEYQDSRSNAGKMVSGTSKLSGAAYSSRGVKNTGPNPAGGSQRPQAQGRMTMGQRTEMQYRKANLKKD